MQNNFYQKYGKRLFDVFFSLIALIILSPFFLVVSILTKLTSKGPVFFVQDRIGRHCISFSLYKFRSMKTGKEGLSITVQGDNRITSFGRVIRKTKIDELPQLLNVLKGDMSFAGSRPEVQQYVSIYQKEYREILEVRPGITDWAAIKFRNEEGVLAQHDDKEKAYIEEVLPVKLQLSLEYVRNISFVTDVKVLAFTLVRIFLN